MRFDDFSGGLYLPEEAAPGTEQPTFAIPPNALRAADDIDFLSSGGVKGRRGSAIVTDSPTGELRIIRRFVQRDRPGKVVTRIAGNPSYDFDAGFGTATWENPFGVDGPNEGRFASNARVVLGGGTISHYLVRRGPGAFTPVPDDATIAGIFVALRIRREDKLVFAIRDYRVHLVNAAGVIAGQSVAGRSTGTTFTATADHPQRLEYGSASDNWDIALTPALVNDPDFGVGFSVEAPGIAGGTLYVASFQIEIHFTVPNTGLTIIGSVTGPNITYELLDVVTGIRTAIPGGTTAAPTRRPWSIIWPQKQKIYFFDGDNDPRVFDGMTMTTLQAAVDSVLEVPRGPYVTLHKGRLYATQPGELQYSVYASEPDRDDQWMPDAHLSVNDEAGGHMTGLASLGEELLIFKDTSLWVAIGSIVYGVQLRQISNVGCVAPDTIQRTPEGVIYLGRDGLKLTDGVNVVDLSLPIKSLFSGRLTEAIFTNAVGRWFPRRQQYWLKLTPASAPGYILHRVASPDGVRLAWSRVPILPMNCAEVFQLSNDDGDLYVGDLAGNVWQRDTGLLDEAQAFTSLVRTHDRILDGKERRLGRVYYLRPLYRGAATCALGLSYDAALSEALTFTAGSALAAVEYQEPRVFVASQTDFGRFVSLRASSAESANWELHRVDLDVRMRGLRRWP